MPREVMTFNNPTFKVAATEAELATAAPMQCQVTSAVVNASVTFSTIPATGCAGPSQSPSAPGYQLDLAWLQDWHVADGLSAFAEANGGSSAWVELTPNATDAATKVTGQVFVVPGQLGGTFGDGSAGTATATWPFVDRPDFALPAGAVAADADDAELVDA